MACTKEPLWRALLQTPGSCPGRHPFLPSASRGPSRRLSHRENPDFLFPEQESVGHSKPQFPSTKPSESQWCLPNGSKEGLAAAQCPSSLRMGSPAHCGIQPRELRGALGDDQLRVLNKTFGLLTYSLNSYPVLYAEYTLVNKTDPVPGVYESYYYLVTDKLKIG